MSDKPRGIDGEQAQRLFDELGSWRAVADAIKRRDGADYTIGALARAAWTWRKAAGVVSRYSRAQYDMTRRGNMDGLGVWWKPPMPKAMRVVPDYRTNTVRPA